MREFSCEFGQQKRLKGIAIADDRLNPNGSIVIFVNAGFISSQGPFRLYTLLARRLAEYKIGSLRFDLGGIGHSEAIELGKPLHQRTMDDIQQAVNYVRNELQCSDIVLCGLCSGAEDSFQYASIDSRIKAVVMIDPHCYQTTGYKLRKLFSLDIPKRMTVKVLRLINRLNNLHGNKKIDKKPPSLIDYQCLTHDKSSAILRKLLDRKVLIHYVYTAGTLENFNSAKQLYEMYPDIELKDRVSIDHLPHIEHTQFLEEDREVMLSCLTRRIVSWCHSN
jgi:hypothetical protein